MQPGVFGELRQIELGGTINGGATMRLTAEMINLRAQGKSYSQIADKVGRCKESVRMAFVQEGARPQVQGRTLHDFQKTYDKDMNTKGKIAQALEELGATWVYEYEFIRHAGVSYNQLASYRKEFDQHVVDVRDKRRVWTGCPKLANTLRGIL